MYQKLSTITGYTIKIGMDDIMFVDNFDMHSQQISQSFLEFLPKYSYHSSWKTTATFCHTVPHSSRYKNKFAREADKMGRDGIGEMMMWAVNNTLSERMKQVCKEPLIGIGLSDKNQ